MHCISKDSAVQYVTYLILVRPLRVIGLQCAPPQRLEVLKPALGGKEHSRMFPQRCLLKQEHSSAMDIGAPTYCEAARLGAAMMLLSCTERAQQEHATMAPSYTRETYWVHELVHIVLSCPMTSGSLGCSGY
ncbi:MAG: hypothetical protein U0520_05195 [Candidatus Saccharimonadales bacterium]